MGEAVAGALRFMWWALWPWGFVGTAAVGLLFIALTTLEMMGERRRVKAGEDR